MTVQQERSSAPVDRRKPGAGARLRRLFNRSRWLARLLGLPASDVPVDRPGLVLIQIDGLSRTQFERGLARRELPFLNRLIRRYGYQVHSHYSGVPSSTPAVQAELFYGVRCAVPAFSFRDRDSGTLIRMFEPEAAARVEQRLRDAGNEGLLTGGSAYSDTFTGGAAEQEAHFCASSLGWGPTLRAARPLALVTLVIMNLYAFVRVAALIVLELAIALVDFARGIVAGQDLIKELKFIPTRVGICILLRELIVIGAKVDIERGIPVVHVNFLGYDEQSHRRGPRSLFAHWTLKGIDDAVARLWRAARGSGHRDYQVWIYSDHGQNHTVPYQRAQGYSIHDAVAMAFDGVAARGERSAGGDTSDGEQAQRVRFLGGRNVQRLFAVPGPRAAPPDADRPLVASLGPVGFVYPSRPLSDVDRARIARDLATVHRVPVVIDTRCAGGLRAWTAAGEFCLPEQCAELFGAAHPFLSAIRADLPRLCHHPDAGDLALLGWRDGVQPLTFAEENGAHAGLSPEELTGFAVLPAGVWLPPRAYPYLRPSDLRAAALRRLGRDSATPARSDDAWQSAAR